MDHDCCHPSETSAPRGRGFDPFLLGAVGVTALLLGLAVLRGGRLGATARVAADGRVAVSVGATEHDWGTVDYDGGIVTTRFAIANAGTGPLRLYDVGTSCTCTTAQLQTSEVTSPRYSMHARSGDVFEVHPGDAADLLVAFDPAAHGPSGVGPVGRTVTMRTNDPARPELQFYVAANVVKRGAP